MEEINGFNIENLKAKYNIKNDIFNDIPIINEIHTNLLEEYYKLVYFLESKCKIENNTLSFTTNIKELPNISLIEILKSLEGVLIREASYLNEMYKKNSNNSRQNIAKNLLLKKIENVIKKFNEIKKIVFPNTIKKIGPYFNDLSSLEEIVLPEGLEEISKGAFKNCKKLNNIILPKSLNEIGEYAFEECESLEEIKIPKSINFLRPYTFAGCSNLKKVTIGEDCEISPNCFLNCNPDLMINDIPYKYWNRYLTRITNNNAFVHLIKSIGIEEEETIDMVINNYQNIINVDIQDIIKNYEYIVSQFPLLKEIIKTKFFHILDGEVNEENILNILFNLHSYELHFNNDINPFIVEATEEHQLELKDRFQLCIYLGLFEEISPDNNVTNDKEKQLYNILTRDYFKSIVAYDKDICIREGIINSISDLQDEDGFNKKEFDGIRYHLYKKLNSISKKLYSTINLSISTIKFDTFVKSLINNKAYNEEKDPIKKATYLKNATVGKILLGLILHYVNDLDQSKNETLEEYIKKILTLINETNMSYIDMDDIIEYAANFEIIIKDIYKAPNNSDRKTIETIINVILEYDPYAYDMLRGIDIPEIKLLDFAIIAKKNGYIFSKADEVKNLELCNKFRNRRQSYTSKKITFRSLQEDILNRISIPILDKKNRKKFLSKLRIAFHDYFNNKKEETLYNILSTVDLYLRINNEYINQNQKKEPLN